MPKRHREGDRDETGVSLSKRQRQSPRYHLSSLSDELLLKILAELPLNSLTLCQRISQRFHSLAGDSELWKEKYYARWVRPRALRILGLKLPTSSSGSLCYSSKLSKWLDHGYLVKRGKETNWKRQYRLRHNWSKGSCRVSEVEVAQPPNPPLLMKFHAGIVFTADSSNGLRAWSMRKKHVLIAGVSLRCAGGEDDIPTVPTALAVDVQQQLSGQINVTIGFENGVFRVYTLQIDAGLFTLRFSLAKSSNGTISAIAFASPYLLTMSHNNTLSLYDFALGSLDADLAADPEPPKLLASLKSNTIWSPLSLSLRSSSTGIIACIAFAFSRIDSGWSVGLQELRLTQDGNDLGSRLASTVDSEFDVFSAAQSTSPADKKHPLQMRSASATHTPSLPPSSTTPTSLSYSHPYLLASHPDNTLTIYLVVSTTGSLGIKMGRRLWGHTSSVSGAQVSDRGKAVSVSSRGNEIRIWELEGLVTSQPSRRKAPLGEGSVQISPEAPAAEERQDLGFVTKAIERRGNGLGLALEDVSSELSLTRGWVGFDDEQVVVLKEKRPGTQILSWYDFT